MFDPTSLVSHFLLLVFAFVIVGLLMMAALWRWVCRAEKEDKKERHGR